MRPHLVEGPARDDGGGNNSDLVKTGRMGNTVVGIAFRSMVAGIDSMGETYCVSGPGAMGASNTSTVMDLRRDFGGTSESGKVVVHREMTICYRDGEDSVNGDADESGMRESLNHGHGQKGIVLNV